MCVCVHVYMRECAPWVGGGGGGERDRQTDRQIDRETEQFTEKYTYTTLTKTKQENINTCSYFQHLQEH